MKIRNRTRRRGAILIAVLVCLAIATTIVLGAVQSSIRQHRQVRQELQLEQTRWLLDAGVGRAMAGFQAQPDSYAGESLTITPALKKFTRATIDISVIKQDPQPERVRLRVTARLGGAAATAPVMQRSQEVVLDTTSSP